MLFGPWYIEKASKIVLLVPLYLQCYLKINDFNENFPALLFPMEKSREKFEVSEKSWRSMSFLYFLPSNLGYRSRQYYESKVLHDLTFDGPPFPKKSITYFDSN